MRTSSNPAFRNLPAAVPGQAGQGYAADQYGNTGGYLQPQTGRAVERPMTIDDVVTKTGITLGVLLVTAAVAWLMLPPAVALPAALVGFVLALVITFKKSVSPPLVIAYAAIEGVFLGAISAWFNSMFNGIVVQAVVATMGVFLGMLVVYKTGAIRVTPKLTKFIVGALIGVVFLMLANLVAGFFVDGGLGLRNGSGLAIVFSLVCIGIAAFSFLLDFDMADRAIREGVPAKFAWYIAFGLTVTLVWLYFEILRLLSYFYSD